MSYHTYSFFYFFIFLRAYLFLSFFCCHAVTTHNGVSHNIICISQIAHVTHQPSISKLGGHPIFNCITTNTTTVVFHGSVAKYDVQKNARAILVDLLVCKRTLLLMMVVKWLGRILRTSWNRASCIDDGSLRVHTSVKSWRCYYLFCQKSMGLQGFNGRVP